MLPYNTHTGILNCTASLNSFDNIFIGDLDPS